MKPRLLSILLALHLLGSPLPVRAKSCTSATIVAPSGAASSIVFTFDAAYECGEFANGDPWVVAPTGGVTITSITPARGAGHDGWNVNPADFNKQPYDQRIDSYDAGQQPALPYTAKAGESIVKTVSLTPLTDTSCRPCLKFAGVLTVLAAAPAVPAFRPPYCGGGAKVPRPTSELQASRRPALDATCAAGSGPTSFAGLAARFRPVQLDHKTNWVGRDMHPVDNLPDYGSDIATENATAALRLMLDDYKDSDPVHRQALVNYVQAGLDWARMAELGMTWPANGGHCNGRKLPVLFAAVLLDDAGLKATAGLAVYSENQQLVFSPKADGGKGLALYGQDCGDSGYWQHIRYGNGARDCRDPYGYIDGGSDEIGGAYQHCCTAMPWKYTALAVRLLQAEAVFKYDPLLTYVDRWMSHGVWAKPDPCAPYDGNPANYGKSYGPDGKGDCIKGGGRYPAKHGTSKADGLYGSGFGDQMWSCFRSCTPSCKGQPGKDAGVATKDGGVARDAAPPRDGTVDEAAMTALDARAELAKPPGLDAGSASSDGCGCALAAAPARGLPAGLALALAALAALGARRRR